MTFYDHQDEIGIDDDEEDLPSSDPNSPQDPIAQEAPGVVLRCALCPELYATECRLNKHAKRHHVKPHQVTR